MTTKMLKENLIQSTKNYFINFFGHLFNIFNDSERFIFFCSVSSEKYSFVDNPNVQRCISKISIFFIRSPSVILTLYRDRFSIL
ncbi:hypothetical protein PGB90_006927 [Kerria lacca]